MQVKDVVTSNLSKPRFIKPLLMQFTTEQDGTAIRRQWECALIADAVAVLLYHKELDAFIIVRQFRAPVYLAHQSTLDQAAQANGDSYEMCAGLIDRNQSVVEIAASEVHEECGYQVSPKSFVRIAIGREAVGVSGSRLEILFADVQSTDHVAEGGGLADEGERIDVLYLPRACADAFFQSNLHLDVSLLLALEWFARHKAPLLPPPKPWKDTVVVAAKLGIPREALLHMSSDRMSTVQVGLQGAGSGWLALGAAMALGVGCGVAIRSLWGR